MAAQHSLNGKAGAHLRWGRASRADRERQGAALADGLRAKFEREADPDGLLSPAERAERAEHLRLAHLARASKAAADARARRRRSA